MFDTHPRSGPKAPAPTTRNSALHSRSGPQLEVHPSPEPELQLLKLHDPQPKFKLAPYKKPTW